MKTIDQLREEADNFYSLWQQAKDACDRMIEKEELPKLKKELTGKCFKYKNGGGGEKWWMYVRVLKVMSLRSMRCLQVQEYLNRIEIVQEDNYGVGNGGGYIPITNAEFNKHFKRISRKITKV